MPDEPDPAPEPESTPEPESEPEPEPTPEPHSKPESEPEPTPHEPTTAATPAPVAPADTGYTPSGVPTFESVREKIETRYGTAIGSAELDAETPEGRSLEEQYDARKKAAAERLEQIRESILDADERDDS